MKSPKENQSNFFKNLFTSPLLLPGLLFFAVNAYSMYEFYHVNSYKILAVCLCTSLLFIWDDVFFWAQKTPDTGGEKPWIVACLMALPLIGTLPGYFYHGGIYNYNFNYELVTQLALILWAVYLYRRTKKSEDLLAFMVMIGLTVLYAFVIALLDRVGLNPFDTTYKPIDRSKSTFGNINYFAGFLVVVIPSLLVLAIPEWKKFQEKEEKEEKKEDLDLPSILTPEEEGKSKKKKKKQGNPKQGNSKQVEKSAAPQLISPQNLFYGIAFLTGAISLFYLTQTRAAAVASLLSLALLAVFYVYLYSNPVWRKRIFLITFLLILMGIGAGFILSQFQEQLNQFPLISRYLELLGSKAWAGRTVPWMAAIESIKASPLVGYGLGSSYNLFFLFVDPVSRLELPDRSYNHVHSEHLEFLQEGGIVGAILFLILWGYLIVALFRILKNKMMDIRLQKLSIGLFCGLFAFHIHGFFSVAARMMVVKLPAFIAIALILIIYHKFCKSTQEKEEAVQKGGMVKKNLLPLIPSTVILSIIWILYIPWAYSQYDFYRILSTPYQHQVQKIQSLERHRDTNPNIYSLDQLANLELNNRRLDQLGITLEKIEKIIPRYRQHGFLKAIHQYHLKNDAAALELAFEHQEIDTYYFHTTRLITQLAARKGDYELFQKQLELVFHKMIIEQKRLQVTKVEDIVFQTNGTGNSIDMKYDKGKLYVTLGQGFLQRFYQAVRQTSVNRGITKQQQSATLQSLDQLVVNMPFFQLTPKPGTSAENVERGKMHFRLYYQLGKEQQEEINKVNSEYQKLMQKATLTKRVSLALEKDREVARVGEKFAPRLKKTNDFLYQYSEWDRYLKRRPLAENMIRTLATLVIPF